MECSKGSTSGKTFFQSMSSGIDGVTTAATTASTVTIAPATTNNGTIPNQINVDKLTCDISKVELTESIVVDKSAIKSTTINAGSDAIATVTTTTTKCKNCHCDINRKARSEESAGIVIVPHDDPQQSNKSTITSVKICTINPCVDDNKTTIVNSKNYVDATSKMPVYRNIERQTFYTNPNHLPPHIRNLSKTHSLDLVENTVGGMSTSVSSESTDGLQKVHPFDQNRPIYPNVPYSPYGSPYGSPRSGRRRAPLRESRRISIERSGSFLQLNQYKLMDQIGQVKKNSIFL